MTPRPASRTPYRARREPREIALATGVALVLVLLTAVAVWILAPDDEPREPVVNPFSPVLERPDTSGTSSPDATSGTTDSTSDTTTDSTSDTTTDTTGSTSQTSAGTTATTSPDG